MWRLIYRQHNTPEQFQKYFDETIENLCAIGKPIFLMSDTNINLLRSSTCNYARNFLFSLQSLMFTPTIDKPTRVHRSSATLIDNIFTNKLDNEIISGNIISDISDHFTQFCIARTPKPKARLFRDYSTFSEQKYLNELSIINWPHAVSERSNRDKLFTKFYNK